MGKSAMLGSLKDTVEMSMALSNVKPCLDFAHLHARSGDGSINSYDEWSRLLDFYAKSLGEQALKELHCHISGINYGEKGEKNHLPIEQSDLDFKGLFQALHEFGCAGRILTESPEEALEGDALLLKRVWAEIDGE
jgi:deoxyribonuclease-4